MKIYSKKNKKIKLKHIDEANEKIERDKRLDVIEREPSQFQLVLWSIMELDKKSREAIFTGDVYNSYQEICEKTGNEILNFLLSKSIFTI